MQINRLFEIVYTLLNTKQSTARELAKKFEVSTRTIYRDVEILSSARIPIYMEKGQGGGIALRSEYIMDKSVLTEDEMNNIRIALQCVNTAMDTELTKSTLLKLSASFNSSSNSIIEVDFEDSESAIKNQFETVKKAISSNNILHFDYVTAYGYEDRRYVEPYSLLFKNKTWYAKCYCIESEEMRIFRLSRMRKLEITDNHFELRDLEVVHYESFLHPEKIKIVLKIDASQKFRIMDEFLDTDIVASDDSYFIVTMEKPDNEYTYRDILSYGSYATVLKPQKIKKQIEKILKKNLENYQ